MSHQSMLPTGKPRTFTTCWNTAPARSFQAESASAFQLTVLSQAIEAMRPSDIGELMVMDAYNAGQLARDLRYSKLIEWDSKAKHLYRITEKGRKYKANPPAEIEAAPPAEIKPGKHLPAASSTVSSTEESTKSRTQKGTEASPPQPPATEEKTKTEKDDLAIPSQADIFQSVAEQLSISKQKDRTPLSAVVYRVQRTADLDDLNSLWNSVKPIAQ